MFGDDGKTNKVVVKKDFWKPDRVFWGDGRNLKGHMPDPENGVFEVPHGFRSEFDIDVPETGWYELRMKKAVLHDLLLDDKPVYFMGKADRKKKDRQKCTNIWITAGKHTLRLQRLGRNGFPCQKFDFFELVSTSKIPSQSIIAEKVDYDVMRCGEPFKIRVTAGGIEKAIKLEIYAKDIMRSESEKKEVFTPVLTSVEFPAGSKPITK